MKMFLFFAILFCCFCQVEAFEIKLEIGSKIPSNLIDCNRDTPLRQTFTDVFDPFMRKEIEGVFYTIAYDKKSQLITYVNTSDFDFKTEDNCKVGDVLELTKQQVSFQPKWEVYGPTTIDGWKPVIGYNRPTKTHSTEFGQIIEEGDPSDGFEKSDTIRVKILSFSKTR